MKHKIIIIIYVVVLLMTTMSCKSQKFAGDWSGRIPRGNGSLALVVHLKQTGNTWQGTMDSPDQQAFGIPLSSVTVVGDSLSIAVQDLLLSYKGKLKNDSIEGEFRQGRFGTMMSLYRGLDAAKPYRPQTPVPPFPYDVTDVKILHKTGGFTIAGTLTAPKDANKTKGTVILISGSGLQDRDETIFGHKPFAVLADQLTRHGYAVLRCDDRGFGESAGDASQATTDTLAGDIESELAYLRQHYPRLTDKVFLIGHSEGGIIAPMVARRVGGIAGLVLVGAPSVKGAEILLSQNAAMDEFATGQPQSQAKRAALEELIRLATAPGSTSDIRARIESYCRSNASVLFPQAMTDEMKEQGIKLMTEQLSNPWMRHFLSYDPAPLLDVASGEGSHPLPPTMAIYGGMDKQVLHEVNMSKMKSLLGTETGNTANKVVYLPEVNHIMQPAEFGTPDEYAFLNRTVATELMEIVCSFLDSL